MPDTTDKEVTPAKPAPAAPAPAPAKIAPPAGTFTDKTFHEVISKVEYSPEEAQAFLAAIDPKGSTESSGKGARIFAAHVGPKGELSFTIYYRP